MLQGDTSLLRPTATRQPAAPECDNPLDRNLALAQRLAVQGTPTLVWADGTRTDGYVDRTVLLARLQQVSKVAGANHEAVRRRVPAAPARLPQPPDWPRRRCCWPGC